jgi:hypothetical protein
MRMTKELSRVHAHVCGDGYICTIKEKRNKADIQKYNRHVTTRTRWIVGYTNTESKLANSFIRDVKTLSPGISVKYRPEKYDIQVRNKAMFLLLKNLKAGGSREWSIPAIIFGNRSALKEWLIAYFDDEAHVEKHRNRIRVKSVNDKGLNQVRSCLKKLSVESKIRNFPTWHMLEISGKEAVDGFYKNVGFTHPKKVRQEST